MDNLSVGYLIIPFLFWFFSFGIFYTYIGYPILVFLIAKTRPEPIYSGNPPQSVTLLIAAYNEEREIEEKIINSLTLNKPGIELQIIIVTDGSIDATPMIVKKYSKAGIELLHEPERQGKMAAINRAIPSAHGEIIVFSDANNYYLPNTIEMLIKPFCDPTIGGVSGAKGIKKGDGVLGASEGLYWKYESFIKQQESRLGSCTSTSGEVMAIRRKLYIPPPYDIINDDFFIAMQIIRQGYRFVYIPEAKSIERISPSAKDEIIRRTRINAGRYQAISLFKKILPPGRFFIKWQVVSHKFMRPLVPFFMIGAFLFNIAALFFLPTTRNLFLLGRPYSGIFLGIQLVFYILALTGNIFPQRERQNRFINLLYLPTFLTNSNLAALKGFNKYIRGRNTHIWEKIERL